MNKGTINKTYGIILTIGFVIFYIGINSIFKDNSGNDIDTYIKVNRMYEGGTITNLLHIPTSNGKIIGNSGITNREGIDFSQQNVSSLKKWGVSVELINKVRPILGLSGQECFDMLNKINISEEESLEISKSFIVYNINEMNKYKNFKNASLNVKTQLIQLRTHTYRLGKGIANILKHSKQEDFIGDLVLELTKLNKGDKNRINKTIKELIKGEINER